MQSFREIEPTVISEDRRSNARCSMELPMLFEVLGDDPITGTGTTVNLSGGGIAFQTSSRVPSDSFLNLWVWWPVPADCGKTLLGYGRVVRNSGKFVAVEVLRYGFESRSRSLSEEISITAS